MQDASGRTPGRLARFYVVRRPPSARRIIGPTTYLILANLRDDVGLQAFLAIAVTGMLLAGGAITGGITITSVAIASAFVPLAVASHTAGRGAEDAHSFTKLLRCYPMSLASYGVARLVAGAMTSIAVLLPLLLLIRASWVPEASAVVVSALTLGCTAWSVALAVVMSGSGRPAFASGSLMLVLALSAGATWVFLRAPPESETAFRLLHLTPAVLSLESIGDSPAVWSISPVWLLVIQAIVLLSVALAAAATWQPNRHGSRSVLWITCAMLMNIAVLVSVPLRAAT